MGQERGPAPTLGLSTFYDPPSRSQRRSSQRRTHDEHHIPASDKVMPTANDKERPVFEPAA